MALDLILKDIVDERVRENFFRIQRFIQENVLLGADWKFIEADVSQASYSYPIPHNLKFRPTDIIPLGADGDYNYYFRTDETDDKNVYVAAHGPVRLRFLVGRYNQSSRRTLKESKLPFVAPNIGQVTGTLSGAGSDGWAFIQDQSHTINNPIALPQGQKVLIRNDGAGPLTNYENAPANAGSWWDAVNSIFWPSHLGEFYTARANFRILPTLNNKNATLYVDIGTANPMISKTFYLNKGAGTESMFSEPLSMPISSGAYSNGIRFMIKCDCDAILYGINLTLIRDFHK